MPSSARLSSPIAALPDRPAAASDHLHAFPHFLSGKLPLLSAATLLSHFYPL